MVKAMPSITCFLFLLVKLIRKLNNRNNLIILCYHRINNKTGIFYDQNISASPEEFKKQMLYIKKHFNVISIDQLLDYYCGKCDLKSNSIIITFDDGFMDSALNAFPVLQVMAIPAVVFPITGFIDSDAIPWEDQIAYFFHKLSDDKVIINSIRLSLQRKKKIPYGSVARN